MFHVFCVCKILVLWIFHLNCWFYCVIQLLIHMLEGDAGGWSEKENDNNVLKFYDIFFETENLLSRYAGKENS